MSFTSLGLSKPLLHSIEEQGYQKPTPIQSKAIPAILTGRDLIATAQTGTGKTASFTLPLLLQLSSKSRVKANQVHALILTPTRELALQVAESVTTYGKHLPLKSAVVFGGIKINPQMMKLRGGVDLLVATPGRLLDLHHKNALKFSQLEYLVLDEADRMLDMGFIQDIQKIISLLPKRRQNLLFSATLSGEIRKLANNILTNPIQIELSPRNPSAKNIKQAVYEVDKSKKAALLSHMVRNRDWQQALIFVRTKKGADQLAKKLRSDGITTAVIHGDKSQGARMQALKEFKANRVCLLVATDLAARGLDISELPHVVNFDLPKVSEDYIHRIGRTGRAGSEGEAISLVSADEVKILSDVENLIHQTLTREIEIGFVPSHNVPITQLSDRPKKIKKPKKVKKQKGS